MRHFITFVLLLLVIAKVIAVLAGGPVALEYDSMSYWRLSSIVMSGDVLLLSDPIAYRTPLFPYFIAIIRSLAGPWSMAAIAACQGLMWIASILIASRIAARMTKLPWAMPLTLLASLPAVSALTFSAAVLSESLFVFFLMLHLLAAMDYAKHSNKKSAIWFAITFSLALLTRPIVILLWIPHLLFLLWIHIRRHARLKKDGLQSAVKLHHRVGHLILAGAIVVTMAAPWLARNHHLFGSPFLTEFVGRNIWIVTFQEGSGTGLDILETPEGNQLKRRLANVSASEDWRTTWKVSDALVKSGLDDAQADRLMKTVSIQAIEANQEAFGEKAFRRIVNYWRCAATDLPIQLTTGDYQDQQTWGWVMPPIEMAIEHRASQLVWANTLLAAVLGLSVLVLLVNGPTRPYGLWLLLIFSYFAVVTGTLEIPDYRYRIIVEPLISLSIGAAAAVLLSRRSKPAKTIKSSKQTTPEPAK